MQFTKGWKNMYHLSVEERKAVRESIAHWRENIRSLIHAEWKDREDEQRWFDLHAKSESCPLCTLVSQHCLGRNENSKPCPLIQADPNLYCDSCDESPWGDVRNACTCIQFNIDKVIKAATALECMLWAVLEGEAK
jgi:hypothetical protein